MTASQHRLVFVIGMHRSGTSMLAQMLARHSQISGLTGTGMFMDEGSLVQKVLPLPPGVGSLALKRHARFDESSAYATPETAAALWDSWSPYWDLSKPVLIEKSPNHIMSTRLLQALFPKAIFICILRHPVAQALAISKWASNRTVLQFLLNWDLCQRRLWSDLPHLKRKIVFRYEDFCAAPQAMFDAFFRFIELAPETVVDRPVTSSNERYYQKWSDTGKGAGFAAQKAAARALFGRSFGRFGYLLDAPHMGEPRVDGLFRISEREATP